MKTLNKASIVFLLINNFNKKPITDAIITCKNSRHACVNKMDGYYVFLNMEDSTYEFDIKCMGYESKSYKVELNSNTGDDIAEIIVALNYSRENYMIYNLEKFLFEIKQDGELVKDTEVLIKLDSKVPFLRVIEPIEKDTNKVTINSSYNGNLLIQEYHCDKYKDREIIFIGYDQEQGCYLSKDKFNEDIQPGALLLPIWKLKTDKNGVAMLPFYQVFMQDNEIKFTAMIDEKKSKFSVDLLEFKKNKEVHVDVELK